MWWARVVRRGRLHRSGDVACPSLHCRRADLSSSPRRSKRRSHHSLYPGLDALCIPDGGDHKVSAERPGAGWPGGRAPGRPAAHPWATEAERPRGPRGPISIGPRMDPGRRETVAKNPENASHLFGSGAISWPIVAISRGAGRCSRGGPSAVSWSTEEFPRSPGRGPTAGFQWRTFRGQDGRNRPPGLFWPAPLLPVLPWGSTLQAVREKTP